MLATAATVATVPEPVVKNSGSVHALQFPAASRARTRAAYRDPATSPVTDCVVPAGVNDRTSPAAGRGTSATADTVTGEREALTGTVGAGTDATAATVDGAWVAFPPVVTVGVGIDATAATVVGTTAVVTVIASDHADQFPAASRARTRTRYTAPGISPVTDCVVPAGVNDRTSPAATRPTDAVAATVETAGTDASYGPTTMTSYPVTPTASVDAVHDRSAVVDPTAVV